MDGTGRRPGSSTGSSAESASPALKRSLEATLAEVLCVPRAKGRPRQKPKRVIADRAYDIGPTARAALKKRGIELIVPYRRQQQAQAL